MNYLWSLVTSSHDAVLRQRLLLPQTQLDARDRISKQLITLQSFLGVPDWGWGANVHSYSPNLAHCAVQTSSMQHRGFATQWSVARRLALRKPRHSQAPRGVREQNGFGLSFLICGRSTRLCGLPLTRPRQTSDPVSRETPITCLTFPLHLWHSIKRQTHIQQVSRFLSGHRNIPVRSTISARVSLRRSRKRTALSSEVTSSTLTFLASVARITIKQP
jgi:hypothetical protein